VHPAVEGNVLADASGEVARECARGKGCEGHAVPPF
jgi:hypothetical protein